MNMKNFPFQKALHKTMSIALLASLAVPGAASAAGVGELSRSTTDKLDQKRYVAAGDRAYVIGSTAGGFEPMGWHIRGEMGGVWAHPIKLLDGYWFGLNGQWLPAATRYTTDTGFVKMEYPEVNGLKVTRTEFAPEGMSVVLIGLTLQPSKTFSKTSVKLTMDVRSELMPAYPWGWSKPENAKQFNGKDEAAYDAKSGVLTFKETGKDWYAKVGAKQLPAEGKTGEDFWGPVTEKEGYLEYGNGTGGRLDWNVTFTDQQAKTIWFAVAGSNLSETDASKTLQEALKHPQKLLQDKIKNRKALLGKSVVNLPDQLLEDAFNWGKLNMADLRRTVENAQIRDTREGTAYPEVIATVPKLTGIGAGFPDYPWYFGTDGAYTAYPLVVSGQFDTAMEHLRTIRDVSKIVNGDTGKVIHELMTDGSVYYGTNQSKGNTNETAQFATAVDLIWKWTGDNAFRDEMYDFVKAGMRYVMSQLDQDKDGWPEGLGMVERDGMGMEKLDVTVYTMQAMQALERMAEGKGDLPTAAWAKETAQTMKNRFELAWWMEGQSVYADSLCNDGDQVSADRTQREGLTNVCTQPDQQLQQRHWITATPMETGLASAEHAHAALDQLESETFTGPTGLYHTGMSGGPQGKGELKVWSLPNSVMAAGEANYGRLGENQALKYMKTIASEIDVEMPGALTEILPSPEYDPFVDFRDRAMFMQAWSSYGVQWPVIHNMLGIVPDAPAKQITVIPHVPASWPDLSVDQLQVGTSLIRAAASHEGDTYTTEVALPSDWKLTIGHILPHNAKVASVTLNGKAIPNYQVTDTAKGREVHLPVQNTKSATLVVTTAAN
ncbi:glycogen debranching protein [Brevibacillus dissolubilis]|uniref:glycogen debranching protein n=1 Tax=Brevibacillus dissolubilis TaxID=1844116 RepID=UPI0011176707|nr:glycogen debranching protein [Brevibacillus dissolubilis]